MWIQINIRYLKDRGRRPEGGRGTGAESNSFTRISLCPKLNLQIKNPTRKWWTQTNEWRRNDPLEVMNTVVKEWDQLDPRLEKYSQNNEQASGWNFPEDKVRWEVSGEDFSFQNPLLFFLKLDSWAIMLQIKWNLDTRVTSTLGTSSRRVFFPNLTISLPILDELK
jgi:hypothetical protein